MTGGVPDSGGGFGRTSSSDGNGEVGTGRGIHPLWTTAMIHPVEKESGGGKSVVGGGGSPQEMPLIYATTFVLKKPAS